MKRTLLFSLFLFLAMPLMAAAQNAGPADELAVRQVIDTYISGNDAEAKNRLFSDNAKIISTANNKVTETSLAVSYRPKQRKMSSSVQKIAAIDLTEGGALVKVETTFSADTPPVTPQPHIQYISLLKAGGEWKIVSILMPPARFEK
jgi:hypothetical protein